jgi:5-methylcytosine-specific restriction endonuclease McrA
VKSNREESLDSDARKRILAKTGGRCHVCGEPLGKEWSADHVQPRARGGEDAEANFLPACRTCNAARWHRRPRVIRRMLRLGVYLLSEVDRGSTLGNRVRDYYLDRRKHNKARREGRRSPTRG